MESSPNDARDAREKITAFLFWFRIVTMALVLVLALSGIKCVPLIPLTLAVAYNTVVLRYRGIITRLLDAYPYLLALDLAFVFYLMFSTGGFKSPYYLYGFSTLLIGSFIFGYRGALVLASLQSSIFFASVHNGSYSIREIVDSGEHLVTDIFFYFIAALSLAYLSRLLRTLDVANIQQMEVRTQLKSAMECLAGVLSTSDLSLREQEVLVRVLDGKKIEDISHDLEISPSTVKTYLCRSYRKLGVDSREDAILKLVAHGQEII